jgi:hypothetical protein
MQAYALVTASTGSFLCFFLKTCWLQCFVLLRPWGV